MRKNLCRAVLCLSLVYMAGCQSAQQTRVEPKANPAKVEARAAIHKVDHTVGNVLADPVPHINHDVAISGLIETTGIKQVSRNLSVLTLEVKDISATALQIEAPPPAGQDAVAMRLDRGAELLGDAARQVRHVHFQALAADPIERISYDLQSASSQMMALSLYYQSRKMPDIGAAIKRISDGYRQVGEAYITIANVSRGTSATSDLPDTPKLQPLVVDAEPTKEFQGAILQAARELLDAADFLIEHRDQIDSPDLRYDYAALSTEIGLSLHSVGHLLAAEAWQYRKNREPQLEQDFQDMSEVFVQLGSGITNINDGFRELGVVLHAAFPTIVFQDDGTVTLRCAYVGYNEDMLRNCQLKLDQLNNRDPVIVHGRLLRGNLMEEMDLLWLRMDSVTVDGMTINLGYKDDSSSRRNMASLYDWAKTIEE